MKTKNCNLFEKGLCVSKINPQPLTNFFESKGVKDGRGSRCKECIRAIAHERRLELAGGHLRVPRRPKSVPVSEKNCSKFKKGECASPVNPQPISHFRLQKGRTNGKSLCLSCENKYMEQNRERAVKRSRVWNEENKTHRKFYNYKKMYGLEKDQYVSMYKRQNGCCAICNIHELELNRPLAVDHNHETGKVRGLLCDTCNQALGFFDDDTKKIELAIKYLEEHSKECAPCADKNSVIPIKKGSL